VTECEGGVDPNVIEFEKRNLKMTIGQHAAWLGDRVMHYGDTVEKFGLLAYCSSILVGVHLISDTANTINLHCHEELMAATVPPASICVRCQKPVVWDSTEGAFEMWYCMECEAHSTGPTVGGEARAPHPPFQYRAEPPSTTGDDIADVGLSMYETVRCKTCMEEDSIPDPGHDPTRKTVKKV
jgi:hypothetical protein